MTTDLIKILKQTCSSLEYNEILGCELQTAMYYPKSQYREKDAFLTEFVYTMSKKRIKKIDYLINLNNNFQPIKTLSIN